MKKLIAKIREILRNRRVRKIWTRTVSSIACLVVFVTTYALVLPAITMESQASCGIEAHQHDDSCYEERLTCTIPEADGHTHTEDCYSTKQKSICDRSEHLHTSDCYDENGNLTCSLEEHQHGRECFEENRELVCGLEEAEGHHHDSSCYEKVLTCGKEAHTHSQACYREDAASEMKTERVAVAATTAALEGGNAAADADGADGSSDAFGTLDPAQTDSEGFVPASDEANLQEPLNGNTAISNNSPAVDETRGSGNNGGSLTEENITEAVEETHPAVSFEDTLTVYTGSLGSDITGSLSSDTNAGNPGNDAAGSPDTDTAAGTFPASSNLTVSVSAEAGTFPAGTIMVLSAVTDMDAVAEAVEGTVDSRTCGFQAVDISFRDRDGNEIEPLKPISVTMRSDSIKAATEDSSMAPVVVHIEDQNKDQNRETAEAKDTPVATVIETLPNTTEDKNHSDAPAATYSPEEISFEADAFSIYAIVYTVDFEYSVDGKMYQFSLPGGGFVSFTDLVEVLGIVDDTNSEKNEDELESETAENAAEKSNNEAAEASGENSDSNTNSDTNTALTLGDVEVTEATRNFVADVEKVEFSSPTLVDVSRVKSAATVGEIKENRGLECEYSAELTEEQIAEINAQTVETGDWALISMRPFTSEETLTVTMKNGEVFTIRVTDYQISTNVLTADGRNYKITVTYDDDAEIPEGTKLTAKEIAAGTDAYLVRMGQTWLEINKEYFEVEELRRNYNESMGFLPEVHLNNLDSSRYFDIKLIYEGKEIEPSAPVHVEIEYVDGLMIEEDSNVGIAHFSDNGIEIIDEVKTKTEDSSVVYFSYEQKSFSDTGTFVSHETHDMGNTAAETLSNSLKGLKALKAGSDRSSDKDEASVEGEGETSFDDSEDLAKPRADKKLEPNKTEKGTEDGTYTLTLSVSGTSKKNSYSEVTKSNVVIVMDRSSSMVDNNTYDKYTGEYDRNLSYYGVLEGTISDDNRVELTYDGNNYYYYSAWNRLRRYNGAIYTRRTRLEAEQDALGSLITQLTDKNMPGQTLTDEEGNTISLDDIIEVKLISFASGRTDQDKANGFKRNEKKVDTKGTTFENTESEWGTTYSNGSTLKKAVDDNSVAKGTNWQEAMQYAKEIADAKKAAQPDETVYVVFLTDGEPTDIKGDNGNAYYHYDNERCLKAAEPDAQKIVEPHTVVTSDNKQVTTDHKFYGIFTYGNTDAMKNYLRRLVNYTYGKGDVGTEGLSGGTKDYYFDADSTDTLLNAFQHILSQVSNSIAFGKVSITDGLTTDAMTTTLVKGRAEGYKYTVTGQLGELYTVTARSPEEGQTEPTVTFTVNGNNYPGVKKTATIDGNTYDYWSCTIGQGDAVVEYKMTLADVDSQGLLTWDLTGIGTLMDGYTYSASFVVWPDQEAYDYVAGLNNELPGFTWSKTASTYEDLTSTKGYEKGGVERFPSIVKYPNGVFAVLTNTEQKVQYSIVDTRVENGETTVTYDGPYNFDLPTPDPMPLTASSSQVEKVWNISRDPDILAQLLYGNPENHYSIGFDIMQDDNTKPYASVSLGWDEEKKEYVWKSSDIIYVKWDNDEHKYVLCEADDPEKLPIGTHWAEDFSIATGLMLSEARMTALGLDKTAYTWTLYPNAEGGTKYYLLEEGHDYTIREPNVGYEFDFDAPVYHPMLVDGVLTNVDLENIVKDSNGKITSYSITGMSSINVAADGRSALTVANTLRGYLNLEKRVLDNNGEVDPSDDTEFEFTLTVSNEHGLFEGDHIPWFAVNDCFYHTVDEDEEWHYYQVDRTGTSGTETTWRVKTEKGSSGPTYTFTSGTFHPDNPDKQTITCTNINDANDIITLDIYGNPTTPDPAGSNKKVKVTRLIRQDQKLTIGNIPAGSSYTVEESEEYGYELKTTSGNTSGIIVPNSDTNVIFTNQKISTDVNILKKKETGEGLSGAIFQLRTVKKTGESHGVEVLASVEIGGIDNFSREIDGKQQEFRSSFETTDTVHSLTNLPDGTYRLYEVYVPAGYINTVPYIEFDVANGTASCSMAADDEKVDFDGTGTISLITITNTLGVALPHTGGPGTRLFTILGSILVFGAGALLWRRRRFI